jgi:hypothetical protein
MSCYWCHWGWPRPIRDIYDDCVKKLGGNWLPLHCGPSHIVWEDENWTSAQWCLDHFDEYSDNRSEHELKVIRESLERLLEVPEEMKVEPSGYLEDENSIAADFPPPEHWECEKR